MNTISHRASRLLNLPLDTPAVVVKFGELPDEEVKKLRDLGLVRGCEVRVLTVQPAGPLLVAVGDARIGVSPTAASEIKVLIN